MRPKSSTKCIVFPYPLQRLGLLVLALLLANGVVHLNVRQAVCATEKAPTSEESESSTDQKDPAADESKSEKNASEPSESSKKSSSNKKSPQKSNDAKSESEKGSDKKAKASDEETIKKDIENEKAKAEEAAGAEVEVVDDSEEEEPEESIEEAPPIVEETEKEPPKVEKRVIGATATIMEKKSELLFRARVDSGAKSCSLHIEDMKIENESDNMADNIGKVVRFNIKNGHKESHWLEAKIAGYVIIKTSNASDDRKRRYKVPLTFRYKDFEKTVLVTLNNREHMEFPLLLGRNFLKNDFLVDVDIESND
ncbi:putative ATP-dependent zinc protease [Bythopirellula polymerisocia]|uniref:Retropepsin-like aspartic endopeptidase domain-containing protein n=1 Tax=Bythopirellula polymerisocia TaxID=2528003 RepID=A0A5C6CUP3_9BACT|nr:RimK/LysX family protein [Bythopirellula polymerisocia]TWU28138.1 hypothetical protein Pla144_14250 [Bythopirellula polymerisocia]